MILYTNQDLSLIFPCDPAKSSCVTIDAHTILEGVNTDKGFVISSVRSTDIKQYLNKKYSLGNTIIL